MNDLLYPMLLIGAFLLTGLILFFVLLSVFGKKKKASRYFLKDRLLTNTEITYYNIINGLFGEEYLILPQINLASVIDKQGSGYRSELFRNADFGIFDFNFRPILLIEINDNTHFRKDRAERDKKVADICRKARIPLITFWTKDGQDRDYIYKTLKKYL